MNCEECLNDQATLLCRDCEQLFCPKCDVIIHSGGKRRTHSRPAVCNSCRSIAIFECESCSQKLCVLCKKFHSGHRVTHLNESRILSVFWDLSNLTSINLSISQLLDEIQKRIVSPKFVYFYSEGWAEYKIQAKGDLVFRYSRSPVKALLQDLINIENSNLTDVLIITVNPNKIKQGLNLARTGGVKIIISSWTTPLVFEVYKPTTVKLSIKTRVQKLDFLLQYFHSEAESGKLQIEKSEIQQYFFLYQDYQFLDVIDEGLYQKKIRKTVVKINENIFTLFSLSCPEIDQKLVSWVVKSFKFDEICPTKKMLKLRLKKIFGFNITKENWQAIKRKYVTNRRSFSVNSSQFLSCTSLFPKGDSWEGLDQLKTDKFSVKNRDFWEDFLEFLESYFSNHYRQGIPYGRYGLCLLIRYCGPKSLKFLSLGKLYHLTNLCLKDEVLQYTSNKLFWRKDFRILDQGTYSKFKSIKKLILKTVAESKSVPLSSLRSVVKANYNIEINLDEFGYSKLRDLIKSLPELEIFNQAVRVKEKSITDPQVILDTIEDIIKGKEYGIPEDVLQKNIQNRLNLSIDWQDYNVRSCEEFVRMYSRNDLEVLKTRECILLFKSNEQKTYSFFFPFKNYFNSAVLESSKVQTQHIYQPVSYSYDLMDRECPVLAKSMHRIINISNVPSDLLSRSPGRDGEDQLTEGYGVEEKKHCGFRSIQHSKQSSFSSWHIRAQSTAVCVEVQESGLNVSWIEKPFGLD